CGAHLESLRRTAVAEFGVAYALTLEQLAERKSKLENPGPPEDTQPGTEDNLFFHPRLLLPLLPCVTADEITASRIRNGRTVNLPELSQARQVKVFCGQRDLIAIASRVAGTLFHPKIVLAGKPVPTTALAH
ncbi:MAG TPA: hypothetical protein VI386_20380, partial [Candidatus Sulfotelmatobacter sp.]